MTILAYISGLLLGASVMGIILINISSKDIDDMSNLTDEAIQLAGKYVNQLIRVGNKITENSEKIGEKLTTELINIITEDVICQDIKK